MRSIWGTNCGRLCCGKDVPAAGPARLGSALLSCPGAVPVGETARGVCGPGLPTEPAPSRASAAGLSREQRCPGGLQTPAHHPQRWVRLFGWPRCLWDVAVCEKQQSRGLELQGAAALIKTN